MITLGTNIPKPKPKAETKKVCNLTDNKVQQFTEVFNSTAILNTSNLADATNQLNSEILMTLDKIAPQQIKKITSRKRNPGMTTISNTKANSQKQGKKMAQVQ